MKVDLMVFVLTYLLKKIKKNKKNFEMPIHMIITLADQNIYTITWLTLVKILLLLIKLGKIDSFNWSNYKYLIKKIYLLKKINFYISNIIASIILTFGTYCDIRQVVANTCQNVKIIASQQNNCGNHPWLKLVALNLLVFI